MTRLPREPSANSRSALRSRPRAGGFPEPTLWLFKLFARYSRGYIRRHFHAVRLARETLPREITGPSVIYLNHPSWWDPLICLFLANTLFPSHMHFAPIDRAMLERYRFFHRLGFFGIDKTRAGAVSFLNVGQEILQHPNGMLWITAQGEFSDPRQRPIKFAAGLGHLLRKSNAITIIPLAIEYPFWHERLPEVLLRFGKPLRSSDFPNQSPLAWTTLLQDGLTDAMNSLATDSVNRNADQFAVMLRNRSGVGGIYDLWRQMKSRISGQPFHPEHGNL